MNKYEILQKVSKKEINILESIKLFNELKPINNTNYSVNKISSINLSPSQIVETIKDEINKKENDIKKGGEDFAKVEYYGRMLLLKTFQEMGFFNKSDEEIKIADIKKEISLIPKYEKMLDILIYILDKEKFIEFKEDTIKTTALSVSDEIKNKINDLEHFKNKTMSKFPDMKPHFILLDTCISNYADIFKGTKDANEVMFPMFSMHLIEGIFKNNMMADYFNDIIAKSIKNVMSKIINNDNKANEKIRILEVGSGTGGTSETVMKIINEYTNDIEFYFTDISKVFVKKANRIYGEQYQFALFKKLDIENDPLEQNIEPGSFDIIFASNVLHATKKISNVLKNIKLLLKNNGILLINEVTNSQDFVNLTFGLMPGWWIFEDQDIRLTNTPLLSIERWKNILKNSNFKNIELVTTSHQDKPDTFSQSLLIAQNEDNILINNIREILSNVYYGILSANDAEELIEIK